MRTHLPRTVEVKEAQFQQFLRDVAQYESAQRCQAAQDRFLDAYSIWLRHRSPITQENLIAAARVLRALDPTFAFALPPHRGGDDA